MIKDIQNRYVDSIFDVKFIPCYGRFSSPTDIYDEMMKTLILRQQHNSTVLGKKKSKSDFHT